MSHFRNFLTTTNTRSAQPLAVFFFCIVALLQSACQRHHIAPPSHAAIGLQADDLHHKLVEIRRDIHQHPELAGNEARTSALIAKHLRGLGLEVHTGQFGHSVVGILRGARAGRTHTGRADLDALPGDFTDPAPFKSKTPGVHHACGHDVHIAIGLGIAEIMARQRASLHGTVVFIFQPEEESFKGAQGMLASGVFSSVTPDEIYGLHVTAFPVGQIVVRANEMFAYQRRVSIQLKNELSTEQVTKLTKHVQDALFRIRPGAKPWEIQSAADPAIGVTSQSNGYQDYLIMDASFATRTENGVLVLETNLYETKAANLDGIVARIEQAIAASGHQQQLLSVSLTQANPTVLNDPKLTSLAISTLQQAGADVRPAFGQVPFFNDDFAYFQQKIPGVYFFLGGSNAEKAQIAMNHALDFQVDETSIKIGVSSFSSLIMARLAAAPQE